MKVLITSATSAQAHKLKNTLTRDEVVLGDFNEFPSFMGIIKLPNPANDTYAHEMLTLSLDNGFKNIYLLNKQELDVLILSEQLFNEYNIIIINACDKL
ncbi:hypothetical protein NAF17_04730 [Mucilaginibacter sp. RB4R14]|uniref:hypothetical protein n=1 Tax=Mucilaginibacter aurantiaciroseus TaxID=2949308 RepID=UPI00209017AB|nr:hypothetical protein [Mucilaginibacter aurantiaciroseus]MCO5934835.1 hypothetical protein [Mucilaginibacter aurantiaciroseus]